MFVVGGIITMIYFLLNFLYTKVIKKDEETDIKGQIRSSFLVYVSSVLGYFIIMNIGGSNSKLAKDNLEAFSGMPGF